MKKLRLIIISLVLLTSIILVEMNSASSVDAVDNTIHTTTTDVGICRLIDQSNRALLFDDNSNKSAADFRFVVSSQKLAEVQPLLSDEQLIDLKRQLIVADRLYQDVLGLSAPLTKPRYQDARYIKVTMESIKGNGLAYDEVTADKALGTADCNISMKFNATLKATNVTPAHELFHLYQNSHFMFKKGWLTEGTARWSQSLLEKGVGKKVSKSLPQTQDELEEVMDLSYAASAMWARLFQLVDNEGEFKIPNATKSVQYLNGTSVIKDNKAYGASFIKVLFDELEEQSNQASSDRGWDRYNWKEKDQKSAANNPYIWRAVQDAVNKTVPANQQSEELKRFVNISLPS